MKLVLDTHTHTIASGHAYSTIEENITAAVYAGLALVAITDHAPGMRNTTSESYFGNIGSIPQAVSVNGKEIKVLKGVELNILSEQGDTDLKEGLLKRLDIAIASIHGVTYQADSVDMTTSAFVNTMRRRYIHIIGHPCDPHYPFEIETVVKCAKETSTLLEVNNSSLVPGSHRSGGDAEMLEMLRLCKKYEVPVVVGSDAHFSYNVGEFTLALKMLEAAGMPDKLVLNADVDVLLEHLKIKSKGRVVK